MKVFCIAAIVLTLGIVATAIDPQVLGSLAGGGNKTRRQIKVSTDDIKTPVETIAKGAEAVAANSGTPVVTAEIKKDEGSTRRRRDVTETVKEGAPKLEKPSVPLPTDAKKEEVKSRRRRDVAGETTVDAGSPKVALPILSTDTKKDESRRRRHDVEAKVPEKVDTPKSEHVAAKTTDSKDTATA